MSGNTSRTRPQPQRAVPDRQRRRAHAAALGIAQQIRPRPGRLTVAIGQRDEFLAAVGAHPDHHQQAQFVLLESDVDVDAVGPQVHVVHAGEVAFGEGTLLGLPGLGELGDRRRRQALRAAEGLPERGHAIPLDSPCRYSSGSTSPIFGVLRAHGGRIAEQNRCRSPVSESMRLSLTRGACTATAPALVTTSRGSW